MKDIIIRIMITITTFFICLNIIIYEKYWIFIVMIIIGITGVLCCAYHDAKKKTKKDD